MVIYIRWGNTTCPYGANTITKELLLKVFTVMKTSPSNLICLPYDTMDNPINVTAGTTACELVSFTVSAEYFVTTEAAVLVLS